MPGFRDAPAISLIEKSDVTDAYVFVDSNPFGGQRAGTGLRFGIGDADGDVTTHQDTSLTEFYTAMVLMPDQPGVEALSSTQGGDGDQTIASTVAPSTIAFDDVVDPHGLSDAFFL